MITALLCLALTLSIFYYLATSITSAASTPGIVDTSHEDEQQSRLVLDEALSEISSDEAISQREQLLKNK